jgi:hypothetical protein
MVAILANLLVGPPVEPFGLGFLGGLESISRVVPPQQRDRGLQEAPVCEAAATRLPMGCYSRIRLGGPIRAPINRCLPLPL